MLGKWGGRALVGAALMLAACAEPHEEAAMEEPPPSAPTASETDGGRDIALDDVIDDEELAELEEPAPATGGVGLIGDCELEAAAAAAYHCMELFFGVNRKLSAAGAELALSGPDAFGDARTLNALFEDERDDLAPDTGWYRSGRVVVTIPKSRRPGDPIVPIGARQRIREITDAERSERFAPYSVELLEHDVYWDAFRDALATADEDAVLLYVHGFNVCFDGAAYRTAQLAYDLGFPGRAAFFSWPANCGGNVFNYGRDISWGLTSEKDLGQFLADLKTRVDPSRLIVIAHSHGSSIVAKTLRDAYGRTLEAGDVDVVVFAAADANEEEFRRFAVEAADLYRSATLYASSRDFATGARRALAQLFGDVNRRVGFFFGTPATFPKVHTVDVTSASLDVFGGDPRLFDYGPVEILINHATYAESPEVIADMSALIAQPVDEGGAPVEPHVRSAGAIDLVCIEETRFWRLTGGGAAGSCPE